MPRLPRPCYAAHDGADTASQALYRKFFELSMDLVCVTNAEGYFVDVSPSFTRVLGYTPDDLLGQHFTTFVHADDAEAAQAELATLAKGIPAMGFENRYRHRNGQYIWLSWNATPDDGGRLYAIARDVTRQKEAERELALQAQWLKRAEEMAQVGHWRVNVAEGTVEWSDEIYRIYGLDRAAFTPTLETAIAAYHPDDRDRVTQVVQDAMREGTPFSFDLRLLRPDGSIRYVRARGEVALDQHGQVATLFGVFLDVTDDHDLRSALALSQVNFTTIFEAVPDAIVFFDADYRIRLANPAFAELFAFPTPQAAEGKSLTVLLASEDTAADVKAEGFGLPEAVALTFCRHDGTTFTGDFSGVNLTPATASTPRGHLAVIRDVTQRQADVQSLKDYAELLQRRNEELQQFAYIASHDLQEPLRTISSFTSLFARRYQGHIDATADDFIRYIVSAADRMQRLINDLLSYSRIGRWEANLTTVDMHQVAHEVVESLSATLEQRGAVVHIAKNMPLLTCDVRMLRVLITNLITNGVTYNNAAVPTLELRAEAREDVLVLAVRDNGIGIDPQFQHRIFEMFKRLHGRDAYSGTGIGLAVCKKVMDAHQGSIWVESALGEGATFYAAFPRSAA
ncbi:MAG: PAS domain S-box protein [Bacteroidota bacterium]